MPHKFRQNSIISEKPGYLSENFDELQLLHVSYLKMRAKGCSGI